MSIRGIGLVLLCLAAGAVGCRRSARAEGEQAVRAYLARLTEAYRASDATLVDPLVGDQQGLKILGLIGVKRDAGVALDAQLLDLQLERAEERDGALVVITRERWHYADRRIGSGQQVGDDSTDGYHLAYRFGRRGGSWILEEIEFLDPPQVGRKSAPLPADSRLLHGLPTKEEEAAAEAAEAAAEAKAKTAPAKKDAKP